MKPKPNAADILGLLAAAGLLVWFLAFADHSRLLSALIVTLCFAFLGRLLGGVDMLGAVAGGMVAFIFYGGTQGPQLFTCLFLVFVLTLAATRVGKRRKIELGIAEHGAGRTAAQVMANVFVPTVLLTAASLLPVCSGTALVILAVSALAEVAADTVSSELGVAAGGPPRLVTSWERVPPGTDGAVTITGSLAGIGAAFLVGVTSVWLLHGEFRTAAVITVAATVGMFVDSLLGATLERGGYLTNNAVNLLSTASAALFAWLIT